MIAWSALPLQAVAGASIPQRRILSSCPLVCRTFKVSPSETLTTTQLSAGGGASALTPLSNLVHPYLGKISRIPKIKVSILCIFIEIVSVIMPLAIVKNFSNMNTVHF